MEAGADQRENRKRAHDGDGKSCGYCMQVLNKDRDPRNLACGHAFCFSCLKDAHSSSDSSNIKCSTCGKVQSCDVDDLQSLATATDGTASPDVLSLCDRCHDKSAVKYCNDCGEKICARHLVFHEGYFEEAHETVDIQKYTENPSLYNKVLTCLHHENKMITMACANCYQFNCKQCSIEMATCSKVPDPDVLLEGLKGSSYYSCNRNNVTQYINKFKRGHAFKFLDEIQAQIIKEFQGELNNASLLVDKCVKLDKVTWKQLDALPDQCKKMIVDVEEKAKEQCQLIEQQKKELIKEIQEYETLWTKKIISFTENLTQTREQIEETIKSVRMFLRDSPVIELVKSREDKLAALRKVNSIYLNSSPLPHVQRLRIGKKMRMEVEFNSQHSFPSTRKDSSTSRSYYGASPPEEYCGHEWETQAAA
ncbi:TNF receptor-associated factor 3-like [Watersipora subatra]|uniref:TNF receptor-associated factor 3-like n=1 Tax=Watersipora subatra TaxID=2589382 RepID=UPI00355C4972